MRSPEWSLIFFTVLIQVSIGTILFISTAFEFSITKLESSIPKDFLVKFFLFIILIIFIALLSSFLHLGKPKNSLYAISHFSSSWLSREIIFIILFTISICLLNLVIYKFSNWVMIKQLLFIAVTLFGIAALYSMIKVYMLPTVPAWNSFSTPIRFLSTTIILGGMSFIVFVLFINKNFGIVFPFGLERLVKIILLIIAVTATVNFAVYLIHLSSLKNIGLAGIKSYNLIFKSNLIAFYIFAGLNVLSIIILFYIGVNSRFLISWPLSFAFAAGFFVVEIISRHLFYAYYARVGI